MRKDLLDDHIIKSYQRWLDYARFHATHARIPDQALDILNEVLLNLLEKDRRFILRLLKKKKNGYTELDYYVLKMIKLNCHSMTSPYRHQYRNVPIDENKDWRTIEIEDIPYEDDNRPEEICRKYQLIREILSSADIPEKEKKIFRWKFFLGNDLNKWKGPEKLSDLYGAFNKVKNMIMDRLKCGFIF